MPDLGKAYVQIVPSAEGISGSISNVLKGEADSAGTQSGSLVGEKLAGALKTVLLGAGIGAAISAAIGQVGALAEYGDQIDKQSQKIGISAKAYQEWDAVLQHSGSSISSMQGAMKKLTSAAASGSDAFEKLGISQEQALSMSQEELFSTVITGLQGMEEGTERTALAQELLGRSAQDMAALLNTSAEETQAMKDRVNELGGVMSDDAVKAAAGYQDALQDMQTAMSGFGRGLVAEFLPGFTSVMNGITTIFSGDAGSGVSMVMQGVESIVQAFATGVPELAARAGEMVVGVVTAIGEQLPSMVEQGTTMVANLVTGFVASLPETITAAGQLITDVINYLAANLPQMMEQGVQMVLNIANGIVQNMPAALEAIGQVILQIVTTIAGHLPELLQKGIELIGQLAAGLIQSIPEAVSGMGQVLSNIKEAVTSVDWLSLGKAIIDGIIAGITSAGSALFGALKDLAGQALSAAKGALKIESPSKVFRDQVGAYIPAGIALGIEDNIGLVTDAMDDVSAAATGTISANISGSFDRSERNGQPFGGVTINVYGAEGQDERILAEHVADIINAQVNSGRAVYA